MSYVAKLSSGKTNGVTYIPEDIKLELDPINVTRVGKPLISHGECSGFTTANYVTIPSAFQPGTNPWEIVLCFKCTAWNANAGLIGRTDHGFFRVDINASGKFVLNYGVNSSSFGVISNVTTNTTLTINTKYWAKFTFTGSAYEVWLSTDGKNYTLDYTKASTTTGIFFTTPLFLGRGKDGVLSNGTIYLDECYFKINNNVWWKGGTGNLTLKKGSKLYIPNGNTFEAVNIEEDVINNSVWGTVEEGFIIWNNHDKKLQIGGVTRLSSGPDAPTITNAQWWLDTNENIVKYYTSGEYKYSGFSLPLAIIDLPGDNGPSANSIKQVFNGFGYIGSIIYGLPGVKTLVPIGLKGDGRFKSQEVTFDKILYSVIQAGTSTRALCYNLNNPTKIDYMGAFHGYIDMRKAVSASGWYFIDDEGAISYLPTPAANDKRINYMGNFTVTDGRITAISVNTNLYEKQINYLGKLEDKYTNGILEIPNDIDLRIDPINAIVNGTPTINGSGVVSNFSSTNFIDVSNMHSTATWELVTCFTTGSDITTAQVISHKEYYFGLQLDTSGNVITYNWQAGASTILFKATVNTKYYVKLIVDNSAKVVSAYYSTNGTTWTTAYVNKSDTSLQVSNATYPKIRFGNSDQGDLTNRIFKGQIHLNECYLNKNGTQVWKGGTGKLTLKAGSKFFFPFGKASINYNAFNIGDTFVRSPFKVNNKYVSGDNLFIKVETTADIYGWRSTETNNGTLRFLNIQVFKDDGNSNTITGAIVTAATSGTSITETGYFYNTEENTCGYYTNGVLGNDGYKSLPIAVSETSNHMIYGSINEVYNGMGYVGSTYYVLPGVKCIAANGLDGMDRFKNVEFTTDTVCMQTFTWNPGANDLYLNSNGSTNDNYPYIGTTDPNGTYRSWYNPETNIMKRSGSTTTMNPVNTVHFAYFEDDNNVPAKITKFISNGKINDLRKQNNFFSSKRGEGGSLILRDWSQPTMTSDNSGIFHVSCSSILSNNATYSAYRAFDKAGPSTYWHSQAGFPAWIQFYNEIPLLVSNINIQNRSVDGSFIDNFGIQYSDDGVNFIEYTKGNSPSQNYSTSFDVTISEPNPHKYWRVVAYSASGSNSGYVAIGEITITAKEFLGYE